MKILKRNGIYENLSFDKISRRLRNLANDSSIGTTLNIDTDIIAQKVVSSIYDGISSSELDEEAARIAATLIENYDYQLLASRIIVSNCHKNTKKNFYDAMCEINKGLLTNNFIEYITKNKDLLNNLIEDNLDYNLDYFGFKTLEKSYLLKNYDETIKKTIIIERPQYLYMRVAIGIHIHPTNVLTENDFNRISFEDIAKTYYYLSNQYYTHATPTLFNAGTRLGANSSCYLIGTNDSIEGIFKTISDCGKISKLAGGIGLHVSNIRSKGSIIRGTNGMSEGIVPMLKVYNETAKYINQGGKRKGSFAIYLEPYHADVVDYLDLKKNQGHDDVRARDLFYAMYINDYFMEMVKTNGKWYLMCPDECKGLNDVYGEEFEKLYKSYIEKKMYKKEINAQELWYKILDLQIETGMPYIVYKDNMNKKCNQKNLGTIKSSNLCVAPETNILTSTGYFNIIDLKDKQVEVWNGQEWSKTTIKQTSEKQELLKVVLSNGSEIECTPYHKFYIETAVRPSNKSKPKQIEAKDLQKNMKLIKTDYPIIKDGLNDFPYPYEHGLFTADGTYESKKESLTQCGNNKYENEKYCLRHYRVYNDTYMQSTNESEKCNAIIGQGFPRVTLYNEKIKLLPFLNKRLDVCKENNNRINVRLPIDLYPKFTVPINYNIDIKLRWLEGLVDGDGSIGNYNNIQIGSIDKDFLTNVKYLLQTLGTDPKITLLHNEEERLLPNHVNGKSLYNCKTSYRLLLTGDDVKKLYNLGFSPKRLLIKPDQFPRKNTKRYITVSDIIYTKRTSDTYCFKEEKRGMGIFNGVLTGNCAEISLYSDDKEYAVCNLCSLCLPKFVKYDENNKPYFDHDGLKELSKFVVRPMNKVIDNNVYPVKETEISNMKHRPIGVGVQGLSDVFIKMKIPFESKEAKQLNKEIFETIYYGCVEGSIEEAKKYGKYLTFDNSPFSQGKLQFHLTSEFDNIELNDMLSGRWNWDTLLKQLKQYGMRNSMLTALMPTASTSQIMGNTECFEQFDSCIFKRRVLSGEFIVCNKYLVKDLTELGLWNSNTKDLIIANNGSIQSLTFIPKEIRDLYKTVWEISMKCVVDMSADRQAFVDQTQSLNLFVKNPNHNLLTKIHFYGWSKKLKTGMYYLRSQPSSLSGKFSVDVEIEKKVREQLVCSIENKDECMACSS